MDLARLETLKDKLVKAKKFSEVMEYFFDHFGENHEFMQLGVAARDPMLEGILTQVANTIFPRGAKINQLLLTRLEPQQFLHGGFTVNGKFGNVIYFEEINMGLMMVAAVDGETKFVRFTGKPLPTGWSPSNN